MVVAQAASFVESDIYFLSLAVLHKCVKYGKYNDLQNQKRYKSYNCLLYGGINCSLRPTPPNSTSPPITGFFIYNVLNVVREAGHCCQLWCKSPPFSIQGPIQIASSMYVYGVCSKYVKYLASVTLPELLPAQVSLWI
jgi:hypothetical protein